MEVTDLISVSKTVRLFHIYWLIVNEAVEEGVYGINLVVFKVVSSNNC